MATRTIKKRPIRYRNKGATPLAPSGDRDTQELRLSLAEEYFRFHLESLNEAGYLSAEVDEAYGRARRPQKKAMKTAERLLETSQAIGDLLSYWQRNRPFIDAGGAPRALPIRGKGATLESLARRFVPDMPLNDVVTAIVRHGEAARLKDDKVALLGTALLLTPKTPELTMASLSWGVQQLARTILHNASLPEGKEAAGYIQRFVAGQLTDAEFAEWHPAVRPELQRAMISAESSLKLPDRKRRKGKLCGVGMFIFRNK